MKLLSTILSVGTVLAAAVALSCYILYPQATSLVLGTALGFAVFLLAWIAVEHKKILQFMQKKTTLRGANKGFAVFLIFGILFFVNVMAKDYNWRKDITKMSLNTLSPQTLKVLNELPISVKLVFFTGAQTRDKADATFRLFKHASRKFTYEIVDPSRSPTLAKSLDIKRLDNGVITAEGSQKQVRVDGSSEEKITNAIIKLLKTKSQTVYFTVGHGEHSINEMAAADGLGVLKSELEKESFQVKELNLFATGSIPADADILIVGGPKSTFFPKELELLSNWMKAGGNVLFALDLDIRESGLSQGAKQIAGILRDLHSVSVMDQMLVDPTSKAANVEPQVLMGFANTQHAITKDFPSSKMGLVANFLFPLTTYIQHNDRGDETFTSLAHTSPNAWAEGDWVELKKGIARFHEGKDFKGQMDLAIAVESKKDPAKGRVVVLGTASIAGNGVIKAASNRDLLLNSVAWLGSQEQSISIRAKEEKDDGLSGNPNAINFVFLLAVFVAPLMLVVAGIMVWRRRLKQ